MLELVNCTELVANVSEAGFTVDLCQTVKRLTVAAFRANGTCGIALAGVGAGLSTSSTEVQLWKGGVSSMAVSGCGGNDAGCSDVLTCRFFTSICSATGSTIVSAVASAAPGAAAQYFRATLAAYVLTAAITLGAAAMAVIVGSGDACAWK
jgi:hypothetical protein